MKTIRQWADQLPEEVRNKILTQSTMLDCEAVSLSAAVCGFAEWDKTVEGFEYWDLILSAVEAGEFGNKQG